MSNLLKKTFLKYLPVLPAIPNICLFILFFRNTEEIFINNSKEIQILKVYFKNDLGLHRAVRDYMMRLYF